MAKRVVYLLGILVSNFGLSAQDPCFNNINQSLVYLNPSFAGSNEFIRNQTVYRNQWPNVSGTYVTYNSCVDGYVRLLNAGMALSVISDEQARGTLQTTGLSFAYAQYITLSQKRQIRIIPSLQVSFNKQTLDRGRLNFADPINSRYGIIWKNTSSVPSALNTYYDLSSGVLIDFKRKANIGVSLSNLLQPNISQPENYKLPIRATIHAAYDIAWGPRANGKVTTLVILQKNYYNFRFNLINSWDKYNFGLGYSLNNQFFVYQGNTNKNYNNIIGFIGFTGRRLSMMYSYNQAIDKRFFSNPIGSHELSLSFGFYRMGCRLPKTSENEQKTGND